MIAQIIVTIDVNKEGAHVITLVDGVPVDDVNLLTGAIDVLAEVQDQVNGKAKGMMKPYSVVFK